MRTLLSVSALAVVLVFQSAAAQAADLSFSEDFSTKGFCDSVATTALWDTAAGEIRLHPFEIRLLDQLGGIPGATSVCLSGDVAYVVDYPDGLKIVDISDPADMVQLSSVTTTGNDLKVTAAGDHAFVTKSSAGFEVFDVSDPMSPVSVGGYNTPGNAYTIALAGDYAYVADDASGLQVYDITDPGTPVPLGSYDTPGNARGVDVAGDLAFVADRATGLLVLDISNPAAPALLGTCDTPGLALDVLVDGDHAFVADYDGGLQVVDVSNPSAPALVGSYPTSGNAKDVAISGDWLYLAAGTQGMLVLDITDPAAPILHHAYDTPTDANGVALAGELAYVADGASGLLALDVADLCTPTLEREVFIGLPIGMAVSGDFAYVVSDRGGDYLDVFDISDPEHPTRVGSADVSVSAAWDVVVEGAYAYAGGYGVEVFDISDPAHPAAVGLYPQTTPWFHVRGLAVSGDLAYLGAQDSLVILDVSDPTHPTKLGGYYTNNAQELAVDGDYVYLGNIAYGFQVFDVSDPTTPTLVGTYPQSSWDVAVSGDLAVSYYDDVQLLDVSDPTHPMLLATIDLAYVGALHIAGDHLFVLVGNELANGAGWYAFDISDPANPIQLWYFPYAGGYDMAVAGDYAFFVDIGVPTEHDLNVLRVYQREADSSRDLAQSLTVAHTPNPVIRTRFGATQHDAIAWQASADAGTSWIPIPTLDQWQRLGVCAQDLRWKANLSFLGGAPWCTQLDIDWLYDCPVLDTIDDVPGDQGGWVHAHFVRSGYDFADETTNPIAAYYLWARVDDGELLAKLADSKGTPVPGTVLAARGDLCQPELLAGLPLTENAGRLFVQADGATRGLPPGAWEVVGSVPGAQQDTYMHLTHTYGDSSSGGIPYLVLVVTAHTTTPSVWYCSPPDSGYSVDNLAPSPPANLRYPTAGMLAWDASPDADFDYFTVYGSEQDHLDESAEVIGYTSGTSVDISGAAFGYYHVTATDFSGNQGEESTLAGASGVDVQDLRPARFALFESAPNPFNPLTSIRFDLPQPRKVHLAIYTVAGRLVRCLMDGQMPAGVHRLQWEGCDDQGRPVASGVYLYRIQAGDFVDSKQVVLTR
jgi:hypothetical protein